MSAADWEGLYGRLVTDYRLVDSAGFGKVVILDHAQQMGRNPVYDDVLLAVASHLGTFRGVRRRWWTQLLRTVAAQRKPTLVVWGDEDRVLPASHLEHARQVFPHAQFRLTEKCEHMPQIECEEEFDAWCGPLSAGSRCRLSPADAVPPTRRRRTVGMFEHAHRTSRNNGQNRPSPRLTPRSGSAAGCVVE